MDLRKAINKLLTEDRKYEYGCAMLYFNFPEMKNIHSLINPQDLYEDPDDSTFGLETEPHCTLLFGLHDEISTENIKHILGNYVFSTCKLSNPSLFKNEKYDVLKFEVEGPNLHLVNKDLRNYPHTNSYPDYQPHCTIAYIKSGLGQKYIDLLNQKQMNQFDLLPSYAVYSKPDGSQDKININID